VIADTCVVLEYSSIELRIIRRKQMKKKTVWVKKTSSGLTIVYVMCAVQLERGVSVRVCVCACEPASCNGA
jgi:hypothetical protein